MSSSPTESLHFTGDLGSMRLLVVRDQLSFCGFVDQAHLPDLPDDTVENSNHPILLQAKAEVLEFLAGTRRTFEVPFTLEAGTPFQQAVWLALLAIPYGRTLSYRALAEKLGAPRAIRAVGAANGRNPLGLIVPCHRVVGSDGGLTGYAGGLPRKAALLKLEGHEDRQLSLI
jgi:methylated-DNA-[protein]-cysteine S-methyltransferase